MNALNTFVCFVGNDTKQNRRIQEKCVEKEEF